MVVDNFATSFVSESSFQRHVYTNEHNSVKQVRQNAKKKKHARLNRKFQQESCSTPPHLFPLSNNKLWIVKLFHNSPGFHENFSFQSEA